MGRRLIEVVQALVDHVHKSGYQQRALKDDICAESQKRIAAEKDRDHWRQARNDAIQAGELMQAEIESLRKQLDDAQRAASDEFVERQVLTVEQQQDAAAWKQQVDGALAEITTLRGAMAADDKRLRDAEERVWPGETRGCDAPDEMADEILYLRQLLDAARAETVDVRKRLNEETDRHRATNAEKIELFQQKESANQHAAELVRERDAALAAVTMQRAGIERLNAFVGEVRNADCYLDVLQALAELSAETPEPAPESNSAATPTGSVVKESLTPAAEGVK